MFVYKCSTGKGEEDKLSMSESLLGNAGLIRDHRYRTGPDAGLNLLTTVKMPMLD
jgi:hypothetical protein